MNLDGAHVVVTGASRGIGAATARACAKAGARVTLLARSEEVDTRVAEIVAAGGQAQALRVDLTDAAAVALAAERILAKGPLDVLVNNAGAGRFLSVAETPPEEAVAMMASPYFAAYYATYAFLPGMLAQGRGRIVNITSPASRIPWPGATAYIAARWAMRGFTEALQADLVGTGVAAMLVTPGKVSSEYFASNPGSETRLPRIARLIPTVTPEAVADAIVSGLQQDRSDVVLPWALGLLFAVHTLMPWPVEALMVRTGWRQPEVVG